MTKKLKDILQYDGIEDRPAQQAANIAGALVGFSAGSGLPLPMRIGAAAVGALALNTAYVSVGGKTVDEFVHNPFEAFGKSAEHLVEGKASLTEVGLLLGGGAVGVKGLQYGAKGISYVTSSGESPEALAQAASEAADASEEAVIDAAEFGGETAAEFEAAAEASAEAAAEAAAAASVEAEGATTFFGAVMEFFAPAAEAAEVALPVVEEAAPLLLLAA